MNNYPKVEELVAKKKLTTREGRTLTAIMSHLSTWEPEGEPGFSDLTAADLPSDLGKTKRSISGFISSLVKKDYIELDWNNGYHIIYITQKTRELY